MLLVGASTICKRKVLVGRSTLYLVTILLHLAKSQIALSASQIANKCHAMQQEVLLG